MPSAKEQAEKIVQHLIAERCTGDGDFDRIVKWVTDQVLTTRREALEEAAQLTESPRYCGCFDFRQCETCAWIATERERCAKELRALAAEDERMTR